MLRRTLRQNKVEGNKVLTDVEILLQARCVPVRVRLAQHRLLLAARNMVHNLCCKNSNVRRQSFQMDGALALMKI